MGSAWLRWSMMMTEYPTEIGPDADNPNCLRIRVRGAPWCKVYGFDPEQAKARADIISEALTDWGKRGGQ